MSTLRILAALGLLLPGITASQQADPAKLTESQRLLQVRARLNAILADAKAQRERSDQAAKTGRAKLAAAERVLAKARENPNDPDSAKVQQQAPAVIERARTAVAEAEASLGAADHRIRLTEAAIRNLKDPDPVPKSGITHEVLQRLATALNGSTEVYYSTTPGFLGDRKQVERLEGILSRLLPGSMDPSRRMKLRIINSNALGGLAGATGDAVYVWNGYLKTGPSDEELTFLLAHELAHAQRDHFVQYEAALGGDSLIQTLDQHGPDHPEFKKHMANVMRRWEERRLVYSREQEQEADVLGLQMALAAGGTVRGVSQLLARIEERHRLATDGMSAREIEEYNKQSTHPSPTERRRALEDTLGTRLP